MEEERIRQRSNAKSEKRKQQRVMAELRNAEEEAERMQQREEHRQRTAEMALRGRKRARLCAGAGRFHAHGS